MRWVAGTNGCCWWTLTHSFLSPLVVGCEPSPEGGYAGATPHGSPHHWREECVGVVWWCVGGTRVARRERHAAVPPPHTTTRSNTNDLSWLASVGPSLCHDRN